MEDWVMCNKCFRPMQNSRVLFSLTQCHHILCSECTQTDVGHCPQCQEPNVKMVTLQRPLQESIAHYFASMSEMAERTCQMAEFQRLQTSIVNHRYCEVEIKYAELKKKYWQARDNMKSLEEVYANLKEDTIKCMNDFEIEELTIRMRRTPCLTIHNEDTEQQQPKQQSKKWMIDEPVNDMPPPQPPITPQSACTRTSGNVQAQIRPKENRHFATAGSEQLYYKLAGASLNRQRGKRQRHGHAKYVPLKLSSSISSLLSTSSSSSASTSHHPKRLTTAAWTRLEQPSKPPPSTN